MAIESSECVCPKCLIGSVEPFQGRLRCTYCGATFAPTTSRERLDRWFRDELAAIDRRHVWRRSAEADDVPVIHEEVEY